VALGGGEWAMQQPRTRFEDVVQMVSDVKKYSLT
jgi:hypothetical protein